MIEEFIIKGRKATADGKTFASYKLEKLGSAEKANLSILNMPADDKMLKVPCAIVAKLDTAKMSIKKTDKGYTRIYVDYVDIVKSENQEAIGEQNEAKINDFFNKSVAKSKK